MRVLWPGIFTWLAPGFMFFMWSHELMSWEPFTGASASSQLWEASLCHLQSMLPSCWFWPSQERNQRALDPLDLLFSLLSLLLQAVWDLVGLLSHLPTLLWPWRQDIIQRSMSTIFSSITAQMFSFMFPLSQLFHTIVNCASREWVSCLYLYLYTHDLIWWMVTVVLQRTAHPTTVSAHDLFPS